VDSDPDVAGPLATIHLARGATSLATDVLERCSDALDDALDGRRSYDDAMSTYQRTRDARALPIYEFTTQMATLEAPPPQMQQLLGAVHGNREAMDAFVSVVAGTMSPIAFFDPDHIGRIMTAATAV
jgi:hypothetical protein